MNTTRIVQDLVSVMLLFTAVNPAVPGITAVRATAIKRVRFSRHGSVMRRHTPDAAVLSPFQYRRGVGGADSGGAGVDGVVRAGNYRQAKEHHVTNIYRQTSGGHCAPLFIAK
jgi:hypothetical protein